MLVFCVHRCVHRPFPWKWKMSEKPFLYMTTDAAETGLWYACIVSIHVFIGPSFENDECLKCSFMVNWMMSLVHRCKLMYNENPFIKTIIINFSFDFIQVTYHTWNHPTPSLRNISLTKFSGTKKIHLKPNQVFDLIWLCCYLKLQALWNKF